MKKYKSLMIALCLFSLVGLFLIPGCNCCKMLPNTTYLILPDPEELAHVKAGDTMYMRSGFGVRQLEFYHGYKDQCNHNSIYIVMGELPGN